MWSGRGGMGGWVGGRLGVGGHGYKTSIVFSLQEVRTPTSMGVVGCGWVQVVASDSLASIVPHNTSIVSLQKVRVHGGAPLEGASALSRGGCAGSAAHPLNTSHPARTLCRAPGCCSRRSPCLRCATST